MRKCFQAPFGTLRTFFYQGGAVRLLSVVIIGIAIGLSGCGIFEVYSDLGNAIFLGKEGMAEKRLNEMTPRWNLWLGKAKDERIRKMGPPEQCATLQTGEEVCTWVVLRPNYQQRLSYTYDRQGIAQEWNYVGDWGKRSSRDPVPAPSSEPAPPVKPE